MSYVETNYSSTAETKLNVDNRVNKNLKVKKTWAVCLESQTDGLFYGLFVWGRGWAQPSQQFQDAFMLLKRAKRLLTSAFPDAGKALFPNTLQTKTDRESVVTQLRTSCLLSLYFCNNKHLLSDASKLQSSYNKLNKLFIPERVNV